MENESFCAICAANYGDNKKTGKQINLLPRFL